MYEIANFVLTMINYSKLPSFEPKPFNTHEYGPLYGIHGKVNHPGTLVKTNFPAPIPFLEQLNGDLSKHIVSSPEYRVAYDQMKRKAYYSNDPKHRLDDYQYETIQQKQITYANGTKINSRDGHFVTKDSFYDTCNKFNLGKSNKI